MKYGIEKEMFMGKRTKKIIFGIAFFSIMLLLPQTVNAKSNKGINIKKTFKESEIIKTCKFYDGNKDGFLNKKEIKNVKEVLIEKNKKSINLKAISKLKYLTYLKVTTNAKIYNMKEIKKLSKLDRLHIKNRKIKRIDLRKNKKLEEIKVDMKGGKVKLYHQSIIKEAEFFGVNGVTSLLKKMPKIQSIQIKNDKTSKILFANDTNDLHKIYLDHTNIRKVDISNCHIVDYIKIIDSKLLKECRFNDIEKIESIIINQGENISKFEIHNVQELKNIEIKNNKQIRELSLGSIPKLETFRWTNGVLQKIQMTDAENLKTIDVSYNEIKTFDYPQLKNLFALKINNNKLEGEFNWNQYPKLTVLECKNNRITKINGMNHTDDVFVLDCDNNCLKVIDLRNTRKVYWITFKRNPGVEIYAKAFGYSSDSEA